MHHNGIRAMDVIHRRRVGLTAEGGRGELRRMHVDRYVYMYICMYTCLYVCM